MRARGPRTLTGPENATASDPQSSGEERAAGAQLHRIDRATLECLELVAQAPLAGLLFEI
jgi:hypothetical protein